MYLHLFAYVLIRAYCSKPATFYVVAFHCMNVIIQTIVRSIYIENTRVWWTVRGDGKHLVHNTKPWMGKIPHPGIPHNQSNVFMTQNLYCFGLVFVLFCCWSHIWHVRVTCLILVPHDYVCAIVSQTFSRSWSSCLSLCSIFWFH